MQGEQLRGVVFWCGIFALVCVRLFFTSDLSTQINYAPHDDSLYLTRAFHFLRGEGFGGYDALILIKYPALSFWLAAMRTLGIPFMLSVNALYIGSGLYLSRAFLLGGVNRWLVLISFALFLFNPVTFGFEWIRILREPLGTGLLVVMAAAIAHIFLGTAQGRQSWLHLSIFSVAFAFSLFLREDDRLLYALLVLFAAGLLWQLEWRRPVSRAMLVFIAATAFAPFALAKAHEHAWRVFVENHYGLPIFHEFSDGEFPRLMAALRSINSVKDNRMVLVTQEALAKLAVEAPSFRPVIERLPKPGAATASCQLQGVCTELGGWIPFLIKEEASRAGLTPSLPAAQAYFRKIRIEIELACTQRRLECTDRGVGLIPPMELRWTRAYVFEAWRLARLTLAPDNNRIETVPVAYDVPIDLGRIYQSMTMADYYDTQLQASIGEHPKGRLYKNPIAPMRERVIEPYQVAGVALIVAAFLAWLVRLWLAPLEPLGPLALAFSVLALFLLVRFAALAYVAVFLGAFTGRMMFATYALAIICSLPVLADSLTALRRAWGRHNP